MFKSLSQISKSKKCVGNWMMLQTLQLKNEQIVCLRLEVDKERSQTNSPQKDIACNYEVHKSKVVQHCTTIV